jgi:hypothetical protein
MALPGASPKKFNFPIVTSGNREYKGRITFSAYKEDTKNLVDAALSLNTGMQVAASQASSINQARLSGSIVQQSTAGFIGTNLTTAPRTPAKIKTGSISLYLPTSLQFADAISYGDVDLGSLGGAAAAALRSNNNNISIAKMGEATLDATGTMALDLWRGLTGGDAGAAAQIAVMRLAKGINSEIGNAIESETQIIVNPNKRSTLRGVALRRFNFTFKLIPTSKLEADEITRIIKFFREEMYPVSEVAFGAANVSLALRFPSKFNIAMSYDGKKIATDILPSFLENINVIYNPNAMAFHADGNFQETNITLNFVEERALSKSDIEKGF